MARVLIVDDDEPIRSMLAMVVQHHGFDVATAADGDQAIDSIDKDGFDVVLLDLMMPRVDGYAVLRHMQRNNPELLPKTIIATAVPERETANSVTEPVFRIHTKPFELSQLIEDVKTVAHVAA